MNLPEIEQSVIEMVRDQHTVIDAVARGRAINMALMRYGSDQPRRSAVEISWLQAGYAAHLPDDWEVSYKITGVTLLLDGMPLQLDLYVAIETMAGFELVLHDRSLPAGSVVRVDYIQPHSAESVQPEHLQAVCAYAAHLLCIQLAAYCSGERESTIGADQSQTESRARNYAARAKEYRAMYFATLGISDPQAAGVPTKAAASVATWPKRNPRHKLVRRESGI